MRAKIKFIVANIRLAVKAESDTIKRERQREIELQVDNSSEYTCEYL